MDQQQLTPEQKRAVTRARVILWVGIIGIIAIGTLVAVYFVFLRQGSESAVNNSNRQNSNANVANVNTATNENTNENLNANTNSATVDTSDWLTYENEEYGFNLKYPAYWYVREPTADTQLTIQNYPLGSRLAAEDDKVVLTMGFVGDLEAWLVQKSDTPETFREGVVHQMGIWDSTGYDVGELQTYNLQDYEAYLFEKEKEQDIYYGDLLEFQLYTLVSGSVFGIEIKIEDHDDTNTEIANQMLSTIQFTTDTSDWLEYENEVSGYSIKYPSDYFIKGQSDGYVVFEHNSIVYAKNSYLHVSVTVEDNDLHTYRLAILTSPATNSESVVEEDITIDGLSGTKITLENALGETIIHHLVSYLGKVYDISAGDSVDSEVLDGFLQSFDITQLADDIDIADVTAFTGKTCVSNNECGAYPCVSGTCLIQECDDDANCPSGTCGQYVTPVPGYCTTMDSL